jgi:hypothetical protein
MIKDSGERKEFTSGAVRDIQDGKGRCDLLPLDVVGEISGDWILEAIGKFQEDGDRHFLEIIIGRCGIFENLYTLFLEVAIHFEEGAKKYEANNWKKGIPVERYIDSAVRHYLKWKRGDKDESHDRAFCWNILCADWTCRNKPELNGYKAEEHTVE